MNDSETNRRTDPALLGILDETAAWAVRDTSGAVVGWAASLRAALTMASDLGREGRKAVALTQQGQDDRVIVFQAQMERLREGTFD